jgi:hypothetical protein
VGLAPGKLINITNRFVAALLSSVAHSQWFQQIGTAL